MKFKRGDCVKDLYGNKGVVVYVFEGVIAVWQANRDSYGLDNCEHYDEVSCRDGSILTVIPEADLFD